MSSECGHHQNPRKILHAANDKLDKGNSFGFDREIFEKDERIQIRSKIEFEAYLQEAEQVMKEEIENFFVNYQPEISWLDFWTKCEHEQ